MSWEELENIYGIKFKLGNGTFRPANEWLDDLYLRYTAQEIIELICAVMDNGEELFKDIFSHNK